MTCLIDLFNGVLNDLLNDLFDDLFNDNAMLAKTYYY